MPSGQQDPRVERPRAQGECTKDPAAGRLKGSSPVGIEGARVRNSARWAGRMMGRVSDCCRSMRLLRVAQNLIQSGLCPLVHSVANSRELIAIT